MDTGRILYNRHQILALIIVLLIYAGSSLASSDRQLESKVWTAESEELLRLEPEIVRKIQENPDSVFHHYLLANVYLRQFTHHPHEEKWLKQAMRLARQAIYLDADSELGYLTLAAIYDIVGNENEAKEVFRIFTWRVKIKKSWRYLVTKARIFLTPDALDNSLSLLKQALLTEGVLPEVVIPYVAVLLDAKHGGNKQELSTELATWQRETPHYLFDQYLAIIYTDEKNYRKAYQLYTDVIARQPDNREAHRNRAVISYRYMNKDQEAQSTMLALLAGENIPAAETAIINTHLGIIYLQQNKDEQAQAQFLHAILSYPGGELLLEFVMATYKQMKKYRELAMLLEQLNVESPGNALYHTLLGDVWTEYVRDYRQAVVAYENAIVLDPHSGSLYNALGLAHYRLQEFEQALQTFARAKSMNVSNASIFYNEACVYALLSRDEEAVSSLRKAIELDASLRDHARIDTDFDKIRAMPAFNRVLKD